MKKEFRYCDRCQANLIHEEELFRELEVRLFSPTHISSEHEGEMKTADLCSFCYNQLIGFMGKINPFTGMKIMKENE